MSLRAARLATQTQLNFRVLEQGPSAFYVTMAYRDENERQTNLDTIERVTGLHPEEHRNE